MNEKNLIPNNMRSPKEVRENGKKGGIASGKARREKRDMRERLKIMLEEKPNQRERIVLRGDRFKNLFPSDLPVSKREDYIAAAMEFYGRHRQKQRERDDAR